LRDWFWRINSAKVQSFATFLITTVGDTQLSAARQWQRGCKCLRI